MTTTEAESSSTRDQLQALTEEMNAWMEATGRKRFPAGKADELRDLGAKRCGKCRSVKNLEDFPRNRSHRDGFHSQCKACNYADTKQWCAENPEYKAKYYSQNREQTLERMAKYYRDHREERKAYDREYRHKHQERLQAYDQNRYWNDKHYRLNHQLYLGYHRAVEAGNPAERIKPQDLLDYWEALGVDPLKCYLTGEKLTPQNRSVDHVVPLGRGGAHTAFNLMPCSLEANRTKNVKPRV
ncbi:hypothetical protein [Corynebacterium halotolerans]|uniref:hypothetical protein n=1 Tax=Corynebacterium halotolerans TaxID=225326 RepID=UPI003CEBD13E